MVTRIQGHEIPEVDLHSPSLLHWCPTLRNTLILSHKVQVYKSADLGHEREKQRDRDGGGGGKGTWGPTTTAGIARGQGVVWCSVAASNGRATKRLSSCERRAARRSESQRRRATEQGCKRAVWSWRGRSRGGRFSPGKWGRKEGMARFLLSFDIDVNSKVPFFFFLRLFTVPFDVVYFYSIYNSQIIYFFSI